MFPSRRITTMGGDKFRDEYSVDFDGTDEYVNTAFQPNYIHTNATMGMWVKMHDFTSEQTMGCHAGKRWYMGFNGTNGFIGVADEYRNDITISPTPVAGEWLHYVVTAIGGTATLYINGVAQGTDSYTQNSSHNPSQTAGNGFLIGARWNSDVSDQESEMHCRISEVFQYDVGLTASQVRTLYNGREPYNHKEGIASGNLKAWWRMGDGQFDRNNLPATFKTGIENGDLNQYLITDASVTPSLSAEKYTATNALADLNNAEAQTGLQVREGGSTITSGTAQTASGRVEGKYAMHIVTTAATDRVSENLDDYLTKGKVYILTCVAKHAGGSGQPAAIRIADSANLDTSGDYMTIEQVSNAETGWAFYGTVFLHTSETGDQGSTEHFGIRENGSPDDAEFYISELSIKEVSGNPGVMKNMTITDFTGDTP